MMLTQPANVPQEIFRANDIRGKVETELRPDVVYAIGRAFGSEMRRHSQSKVIIARDGRLSSPLLSNSLSKGLLESGIDVVDIGPTPTPLMYFATHVLKIRNGIMVTGSHNPPNENGLKILLDGQILNEIQIQSLYESIQTRNFLSGSGTLTHDNLLSRYYSEVQSNISLKRRLRVVVDCGNGIVGAAFPDLARKLGCDVIELCCEVDGTFPNHFPDPSVEKNLAPLKCSVLANQADLGVAFDGDGDRLGVIDNIGEIIWPDRVLMLFAAQALQSNPGAKIIYDVKCTRLLDAWIRERSGQPIMWKTGHSLIKSKIKDETAQLAGEMSGHFYFADRWYGFDDGLYAAARLLEIVSQQSLSGSALFASIPDCVNTPEIRLAMADNKKFAFMREFQQNATFENGKVTSIDGVRVDFERGFGLVRASNTSPYLIMRFEADDQDNLTRIQDTFRRQLLDLDSTLQMPF